MTLNATGPISLGGPTTGESVNIELGKAPTAVITTNDTDVRDLAGQPTLLSPIVVPVDFWGKSFVPTGSYISSISSLFNLYTADYGGMSIGYAVSAINNAYVLTQWSSGGINYAQVQRYDTTGAIKAQKLYIGTTNGYAESLQVYDNISQTNRPARITSTSKFYIVGIATANEVKYIKLMYIEPYDLLPAWSVAYKALAFRPSNPYDGLSYITNPAVNNDGDVLCAFWTQYYSAGLGTTDNRINLLSLKNISSAGVVGTTALQKITFTSVPVEPENADYLYPQVIARTDPADTDFTCLIGGYQSTYDYGNIPFLMSVKDDGSVLNTFRIINVPKGPSNELQNYYADYAGVTCITTGASGVMYVGMYIDSASYLIKTDAGLNIIWAKKVSGNPSGVSTFNSITVDSSENIYTTGSCVYEGYQVCSIFKFNSSGVLQWARYIKRTDIPYQSIGFGIGYAPSSPAAITISVNLFGNTSTLRLPADGSKTGNYSTGGVPIIYAVLPITPTDATSELDRVYIQTFWASAPVTVVASTATPYNTDFVSSVSNI
jgi:hypothetical protein